MDIITVISVLNIFQIRFQFFNVTNKLLFMNSTCPKTLAFFSIFLEISNNLIFSTVHYISLGHSNVSVIRKDIFQVQLNCGKSTPFVYTIMNCLASNITKLQRENIRQRGKDQAREVQQVGNLGKDICCQSRFNSMQYSLI